MNIIFIKCESELKATVYEKIKFCEKKTEEINVIIKITSVFPPYSTRDENGVLPIRSSQDTIRDRKPGSSTSSPDKKVTNLNLMSE